MGSGFREVHDVSNISTVFSRVAKVKEGGNKSPSFECSSLASLETGLFMFFAAPKVDSIGDAGVVRVTSSIDVSKKDFSGDWVVVDKTDVLGSARSADGANDIWSKLEFGERLIRDGEDGCSGLDAVA